MWLITGTQAAKMAAAALKRNQNIFYLPPCFPVAGAFFPVQIDRAGWKTSGSVAGEYFMLEYNAALLTRRLNSVLKFEPDIDRRAKHRIYGTKSFVPCFTIRSNQNIRYCVSYLLHFLEFFSGKIFLVTDSAPFFRRFLLHGKLCKGQGNSFNWIFFHGFSSFSASFRGFVERPQVGRSENLAQCVVYTIVFPSSRRTWKTAPG